MRKERSLDELYEDPERADSLERGTLSKFFNAAEHIGEEHRCF